MSPFFTGKLALRMGRRRDIPVTATFHGDYCAQALEITHSRLIAHILKHLIVSFYVRADYVWAPSLDAAMILRKYGYNGPISVMESGTDAASWQAILPRVLTAYRTRSAEGHMEKLPGIFDE